MCTLNNNNNRLVYRYGNLECSQKHATAALHLETRAATTDRYKSIIRIVGNKFLYRFVVSRDYYAAQ